MIVSIEQAAGLIKKGKVVAIPTETVYGLAADAANALAVQKTFNLKGRPADNPLIVHVGSVADVDNFTDNFTNEARLLAESCWPGPLTLVLNKKNSVLDIITAGLDTVALRMPDHADTLELLKKCGPVTAPSANRSGRPSPTRPVHVTDDFGDDFPVVDGGECSIGIESTVLDLTSSPPSILRPGRISVSELSSILSIPVESVPKENDQFKKSPGTRYSHYKPQAEVRWLPESFDGPLQDEFLYIFHSGDHQNNSSNVIDFNRDYNALARALYDLYRTADRKKFTTIYIQPLPKELSSPILPALENRIQHSVSQ